MVSAHVALRYDIYYLNLEFFECELMLTWFAEQAKPPRRSRMLLVASHTRQRSRPATQRATHRSTRARPRELHRRPRVQRRRLQERPRERHTRQLARPRSISAKCAVHDPISLYYIMSDLLSDLYAIAILHFIRITENNENKNMSTMMQIN